MLDTIDNRYLIESQSEDIANNIFVFKVLDLKSNSYKILEVPMSEFYRWNTKAEDIINYKVI